MEPERDRPTPRRAGRPRIWTSNAERARAYRAAKATELAEPMQLRTQLLALRRDHRVVREELARERKRSSALRRALDSSNLRLNSEHERADRLERQLQDTQVQLDRLRLRVRDSMAGPRFEMNRAQRRALARRR